MEREKTWEVKGSGTTLRVKQHTEQRIILTSTNFYDDLSNYLDCGSIAHAQLQALLDAAGDDRIEIPVNDYYHAGDNGPGSGVSETRAPRGTVLIVGGERIAWLKAALAELT